MSSPARPIEVYCQGCGGTFSTLSYRPTINLTLEDWTEEEIHDATTATCPECGRVAHLTALLVDGGEFRVLTDPDA